MKHIYDCTLLVVDDNKELCRMIEGILRREGFCNIDMAFDVRETEAYFMHKEPHLVILDINLPDGDGFSLMQKIRTVSDVPVLFLSARDEDSDRLFGLGLGADDYMVKPFLPKELTLRVSAILKRTYCSRKVEEKETEEFFLGDCRVSFKSGTVKWEKRREEISEISLTAKELLILKNCGKTKEISSPLTNCVRQCGRIIILDMKIQSWCISEGSERK